MTHTNNQNVYIQSLEASNIMAHMTRGNYINSNFSGMLPHSLHLIQLKKEGLSTYESQFNKDIIRTKDIINVKFKSNLRSLVKIISDNKRTIKNKVIRNESDEEYVKNLKEYTKQLEEELEVNGDDEKWNKATIRQLREQLYRDGFTITNQDGSEDVYRLYVRSSSKSRNGECLFIIDHLHDTMTAYNRMGLNIPEDSNINLASLRAYESLIGSSIEDTIVINPDNILVIDDVISTFTQEANVVKMNSEGELYNTHEDVEINNDIWDGQSLLDERYFDGEGFKLLRSHFFKSAAFNTNLTQYYKDIAKQKGIDYDTWVVNDIFGNEIKVSDIHMVVTPNSLKNLAFSELVGTKREMFEYWKKVVNADDNVFGVCFSEQQSKHVIQGTVYRELSYQILNSMPATKEDVERLSEFEVGYIDQLKNDDVVFIQHLEEGKNDQNSNEMFITLYQQNKGIANTSMFKELRKRTINNHVNKCKSGKIRVANTDYNVMIGNGLEMLKASIGEFDINTFEPLLQPNEVYSTMFDDGVELAGYRNPHTSQSNVWYLHNKVVDEIDEYFNSTDQIVHITSINVDTLDRLSGSDFDSDDVLLSSDSTLVRLAKECFDNHDVVINAVQGDTTPYQLNAYDLYSVDQDLSKSTQLIGLVTNRAQLLLSVYWDRLANGKSVDGLMDSIAILTSLSGLSIDLAKQKVDINIEQAVRDIQKTFELKADENGKRRNPNFWVNVSKNSNTRNNVMAYDTAMDYLHEVMSNLDVADYKRTVKIESLLVDADHRRANRRQSKMLNDLIGEMQGKIINIYGSFRIANDDEINERNNMLDEVTSDYMSRIGRYRVNENTMYDVLRRLDGSSISVRLMNTLFKTQNKVFMEAFK